MSEEKYVKIFIPQNTNPDIAKLEQFKVYQRDGVTVQVPIGKICDVPKWVAEIALDVGDIVEILG